MLEGLAEVAREQGRIGDIASDLLAIRRELARVLVAKLHDVAPSSLDRVDEAIAELERAVDRGASAQELARVDLDVIAAFVDATGSAVLALCINPILGVLAELPELAAAVYAEPRTNVLAYRFAVAEVRSGGGDISKLLDLLIERDEDTMRILRGAKRTRRKDR
jgi:DNA-binding GntR family transcriptional regulator